MSTSSNESVLYEIQGNVAKIRLNLPEIHNAFDDQIIERLISLIGETNENQNLRACVLEAEGKHFSAGANLNWMKRMASMSYEENLQDARRLATLMHDLNSLSIPTLVKVQGAAFGGALGLISCCDIAIASDKAKFCLSEVKLGLSPATISPYVLKALGERRCRQLFLTAEVFNAYQAERWGLIHEVTSPEMLDEQVQKKLDLILATGPVASRATKALIRGIQDPATNVFEYTAELIARLRVSDEGQEGLSCFFEGKRPRWNMEASDD